MLKHQPRDLKPDGQFFNGLSNNRVIMKLVSMYDLASLNGEVGRIMYRGRPIIVMACEEISGYRFSVCDEEDSEAVRMAYKFVPFRPALNAPKCAVTRLQVQVSERAAESLRVMKEAKDDAQLMSLIGVIGDQTEICWYDYGISQNNPIVGKVKEYFKALGYETNSTLSSNWCNERTFLEIDRRYLEDQILLKGLMS